MSSRRIVPVAAEHHDAWRRLFAGWTTKRSNTGERRLYDPIATGAPVVVNNATRL